MAAEIERKWVAEKVPPADALGEGTPLRQGYVAIDGVVVVRVRIAPTVAWLTIKADTTALSRIEVEMTLPLEEAEQLWPLTVGRRIDKTRHRIPLGTLTAEVDVFGDALSGLCVVEVEFPSEADAEAFVAPAWFGREVTGDPRWTNALLARFGLPAS